MVTTPSPSHLRKEVLQLYREVLRTARLFRGQLDESKRDYCQVVCTSARSEIDQARHLTSSEDIMRRIVTARAALDQIQIQTIDINNSGDAAYVSVLDNDDNDDVCAAQKIADKVQGKK